MNTEHKCVVVVAHIYFCPFRRVRFRFGWFLPLGSSLGFILSLGACMFHAPRYNAVRPSGRTRPTGSNCTPIHGTFRRSRLHDPCIYARTGLYRSPVELLGGTPAPPRHPRWGCLRTPSPFPQKARGGEVLLLTGHYAQLGFTCTCMY